MLDAIPPILLVEVDDALGVAMRAEGVAQSDELLAKRQVIVDFSIEDDPNGAVLVAEGLVPSGEVHNTQPAHAYAGAVVCVDSVVIRSAMRHDVAHPAQLSRVGPRVPSKFQDSSYSAHSGTPSVGTSLAVASSAESDRNEPT